MIRPPSSSVGVTEVGDNREAVPRRRSRAEIFIRQRTREGKYGGAASRTVGRVAAAAAAVRRRAGVARAVYLRDSVVLVRTAVGRLFTKSSHATRCPVQRRASRPRHLVGDDD